jgi:GTP pyrophosphokinase
MHLKQLQTFFAYEPHTEDPQVLVEDIVHQARRYLTSEQCEDIYTTYEYARQAHGTQKRLSGEEYIVHPLKATLFLMDMKPDLASIQACILHDVIEDTPLTYDDIHDTFSKEVAILCTGLVKVSTIKYRGEERQLETLKKTFLAMAHDLRVIFIKIVDRIHNIQTIAYHPNPEKRERIARETMMVYVPIAKRL